MSLLKWCVFLTFLAVVLSDDIPEITQLVLLANEVKYQSRPKGLVANRFSWKEMEHVFNFLDSCFYNSSFTTDEKRYVALLNKYSDDLFSLLNVYLYTNNLDQTELPGFTKTFKVSIFFNGWIKLKDGLLYGLSTIHRTGNVVVKCNQPNIKLSIPLGFADLQSSHNYEMKLGDLGPSGTVKSKSENNKFTVDLEINKATLRAKLDKFDLNTVGSVSLKFSGNELTDWIANLTLSVVLRILEPILGKVIEGYVVDGVQYTLDHYNHAVCKILANCPQ